MITREEATECVRRLDGPGCLSNLLFYYAKTVVALYDEMDARVGFLRREVEQAEATEEHYRLELRRVRAAEAPVTDDAAFRGTGWHFSIGRQCWVHKSGATVARGPGGATIDAMRAAVPESV